MHNSEEVYHADLEVHLILLRIVQVGISPKAVSGFSFHWAGFPLPGASRHNIKLTLCQQKLSTHCGVNPVVGRKYGRIPFWVGPRVQQTNTAS